MYARQQIGHWLNELPNRDIDRRELADLCADYDQLQEVARLAQASLDARNSEARAQMAFENAGANFHDMQPEAKAYSKAMVLASMADTALREALAKVHNASVTGLAPKGDKS